MDLLFVNCGDPDPSVRDQHGGFVDWFSDVFGDDCRLHVVDARHDAVGPACLARRDALVISGSSHAAYEPHPWIPPLEALVRTAYGKGVPTLGVCFGHQIAAQALGGRVVRNPLGREMGTVRLHRTDAGRSNALLEALPDTFEAQVTHGDTVHAPPPGARVLATSAHDACHAFQLGNTFGVQFHPEVTAPVLRAYVRSRAEMLRREGFDPNLLHASIQDTDTGRHVIQAFRRFTVSQRRRSAGRLNP